MSGVACVVLDASSVCVLAADGRAEPVERPWTPGDPASLTAAAAPVIGAPSAIVLVIGLGLLEIAEPELPPLSPAARRALVCRDGDRYFPLDEPVAVALADTLALAVPSRDLQAWVHALGTLAPVTAVVSAPQVVASVVGSGAAHLPAAAQETGVLEARDGVVVALRRARGPTTVTPADRSAAPRTTNIVTVDAATIARTARDWRHAPIDVQLLDATLMDRAQRARRRRWGASIALALASLVLLAAAGDRARTRRLEALRADILRLEAQAAPAELAAARSARARNELLVLTAATQRSGAPDAPLRVLAQLSRVLPDDIIVQRLEWNGEQWRMEGTANRAAQLVPVLDGAGAFRDVQSAAPSQRFLDVGRVRESFAVTFRTRAAEGGTNGAP